LRLLRNSTPSVCGGTNVHQPRSGGIGKPATSVAGGEGGSGKRESASADGTGLVEACLSGPPGYSFSGTMVWSPRQKVATLINSPSALGMIMVGP